MLGREKIPEFMGNRMTALDDLITRDLGGGLSTKVDSFNEVKYWKEAIERGEFEKHMSEVYIIYSETYPDVINSEFYTDKESVIRMVDLLNTVAGREIFWYTTLTKSK